MKRINLIAVIALILLANLYVNAQSKTITQNQIEQHKRIKQGVRNGQLTKAEAKKLRTEQRIIRAEKRMAKADGKITRQERRMIKQNQRVASANIHHEKYDAEHK